MPIAKSLIDKMGGTITFESKKDVGTTFIITLPFRIATEEDKGVVHKPADDSSIKGLNLLLVEDNELNMEIAKLLVKVVSELVNGKNK